MSICDQIMNKLNSISSKVNSSGSSDTSTKLNAILNAQGQNTADIVSTRNAVNQLSNSVNAVLNSQGQNTADIVKTKQYIEKINTMLGIPNN